MPSILSIFCLYLLFLSGQIITRLKSVRRIFLPAAVTAGILGLVLLQLLGPRVPAVLTQGWEGLPALLINVVFAALFMSFQVVPSSPGQIWSYCGPQLLYGQLVAWGQYVISLGLSWLVLSRIFSVPDFMGLIIPLGFEGGHGTTAAMQPVFAALNWPEGTDYSFAAATGGILTALASGIVLINWAIRKKHTAVLTNLDEVSDSFSLLDQEDQSTPQDRTGFSWPALGSLAWQLFLIGMAVLAGVMAKHGSVLLESLVRGGDSRFVSALPLAPFSILGAVVIHVLLRRYWPAVPVNYPLMQRLSGMALDFLIVAAVASLNLGTIARGFLPFLILVLGAVGWNVFCVLWLARRILPDAWFERSIVQLGQSMGVTSTGLLLLRVVDPRLETKAVSAFGYKQLIHEPLMGAGLWPFIAVPLAITHGPGVVLLISVGAMLGWALVWGIAFRHKKADTG